MTIICLWLIVCSQGVVWRKSMLRVHWLSDPSFDGQFPNQISMYANVCYNRVEPRRHLSCLSSPSHITPTLLPVFVVAGLSCLPHTALSVAHVLNHIFGWMLPPFCLEASVIWKTFWEIHLNFETQVTGVLGEDYFLTNWQSSCPVVTWDTRLAGVTDQRPERSCQDWQGDHRWSCQNQRRGSAYRTQQVRFIQKG